MLWYRLFPSQLFSRLPYAAHRRSFDPVKLKAFKPRTAFISYAGLVIKQYAAERHVHFSYR